MIGLQGVINTCCKGQKSVRSSILVRSMNGISFDGFLRDRSGEPRDVDDRGSTGSDPALKFSGLGAKRRSHRDAGVRYLINNNYSGFRVDGTDP